MNSIFKMKKFIVKKEQLIEYVDRKKSEAIFYEILEHLHKNSKMLNENISYIKANQSVIDNYRRKNLITQRVFNMLTKFNVIDENYEII